MRFGLLLITLAPKNALACAVCFSVGSDTRLVKAITLGIIFLLVSVYSVVTVFVLSVWRIEKHRMLADRGKLS